MKITELVAMLTEWMDTEGDISIYMGDMREPILSVETTDPECVDAHGEKYIFVE